MKKNILDYDFPKDLKGMSIEEMELLSYSIREFLIDKVSVNGGHLASNLVEILNVWWGAWYALVIHHFKGGSVFRALTFIKQNAPTLGAPKKKASNQIDDCLLLNYVQL